MSASVSLIQKTTPEAITAVNDFIVVNKKESLTWIVGDKIDFALKTEHGKAPFKWDFVNLPEQLIAGSDGIIRGVFEQEGYYSFSASVSDAEGNAADSFFTFNVQPKALLPSIVFSMQTPLSLRSPTAMSPSDTTSSKLLSSKLPAATLSSQPSRWSLLDRRKLR